MAARADDPYVFSPSQVDTFLTCKRQWAWRSVARIRAPEKDSAKLGTEVHLQLEGYLSGHAFDFERADEAGYIAAAGVRFLPDPDMRGKTDDEIAQLSRDVLIEEDFRFTSPRTGFVWVGRIDLDLADSGLLPGYAEQLGVWSENGRTGVPAIHDHKSTSSRRWAKTPEILKWDSQGVIYSKKKFLESPTNAVDLSWVYYQTKGARTSWRVQLRMYREHVEQAFVIVEDVAREMADVHDVARAVIANTEGPPDLGAVVRSLPPNPAACEKFGGCPYEHLCQLSLAERIKAAMSSDETLDSLAARAAQQDGGSQYQPQNVMGMRAEDVPAPVGLPDWLTGKSAPAPAAPPPPPATSTPQATAPAPQPEQRHDAPINPPEASQPIVQLPPEVAPPPTVDTTPTAPAPAEKPKRGGGRKKKDAQQPLPDVPAATTNELVTYTPQDQAAAKALCESMTFPDDGFTLYLDCAPVGITYTPAELYIARAKASISETDFVRATGETYRVADYRFLPFGQGAGALTGAVIVELEKEPPTHLVLSTRTPEGAIVVNDLVAKANFVVRGAA